MTEDARRARRDLLHRLREALSREERDALLAETIGALDDPGRERLLSRLPVETAEALAGALEAAPGTPAAAGVRKVRKLWEKFLGHWSRILLETGLEDGKYVSDSPHWEPPSLDDGLVETDLDEEAKKILPYIDRVVAEGIDQDLTPENFLAETREEYGAGLPEWFQEPSDAPSLGPAATELVCRWSIFLSLREGRGGLGVAENLLFLHAESELWLEGDGIRNALLAMPPEAQEDLVRGFDTWEARDLFGDVLGDPRSPWEQAFTEMAERHAPEIALAWDREGIDDAIVSLAGSPVDLARELLAAKIRREHVFVEPELVARLLHRAERAAASAGDEDRTRVVRLQAGLAAAMDRWDLLPAALAGLPEHLSPVRDALLADLRDVVAGESLPPDLADDPRARYTDALLDAVLGGREAGPDVIERLRGLVAAAKGDGFSRYRPALAGLALDVAGEDGFAGKPSLKALLQEQASCWDEFEEIRDARRAAACAAGAKELLPEILAVFVAHAEEIVPDPSTARKSRYRMHASALAGIRELDIDAAERILKRWRADHPRRRNLFRALEKAGL